MDLVDDEPTKKSKCIALKYKEKSGKALPAVESEEETLEGDSKDGSNAEEMTFLTKTFQ